MIFLILVIAKLFAEYVVTHVAGPVSGQSLHFGIGNIKYAKW